MEQKNGQLPLDHFFGVCNSFKSFTKRFGFHLVFITTDLKDVFCTTLAKGKTVTSNSLYLFVPNINPDSEKEKRFN